MYWSNFLGNCETGKIIRIFDVVEPRRRERERKGEGSVCGGREVFDLRWYLALFWGERKLLLSHPNNNNNNNRKTWQNRYGEALPSPVGRNFD